jgi:CHAD domain-containing protein
MTTITSEAGQNKSFLINALKERWKTYRAQAKLCRREFSEEAVHDLRVATRRLLVALDILRAVKPHPRIQRARRYIKDRLDDFDDLRDTQVMLVETSENKESLPDLKAFEDLLKEREKRLLRKARKRIRSIKLSELSGRIGKIAEWLEEGEDQEQFHDQALQAADNAYLRAFQAFEQTDGTRLGAIHHLRLAFKKFRYMIEIIHPQIPGYPESCLKRMHDYQSAMGDIQDVETFLNMATEFSEGEPSALNLESIRGYYEKRRVEVVSAFLKDKGEFLAFWRAAPDQPYPWEKSHDTVHHSSRHRGGGGQSRRRRQPTSAEREGSQEDESHRAGLEGTGDSIRLDSDQSLPARDSDRAHSVEEV